MKPCPERLRDKVALVTGGARGIGRAICERFAAEGARVAVADLDATECARVAGEIREGTFGVRLDVTNQGSIDAAVGAVVEKFGRIDVLINTSGVWELQPPLEMTRERTARVFAVNVEGLIFTTQAVARQGKHWRAPFQVPRFAASPPKRIPRTDTKPASSRQSPNSFDL